MLFAFADSPATSSAVSAPHGPAQSARKRWLVSRLSRGAHTPSAAAVAPPIDGLYLGGGGVYPGIPGSLGGYNAPRVVCSDLGLEVVARPGERRARARGRPPPRGPHRV